MKNAVMILGAGASLEFLRSKCNLCLSTKTLTDWIKSTAITDLKTCNFGLKPDAISEVMDSTVNALNKNLGTTFNFEHLIHLVDRYCSMVNDKATKIGFLNPEEYYSMNLAFADVIKAVLPAKPSKQVVYLPYFLRNLLLRFVSTFSESNESSSVWAKFLKRVVSTQDLSIYSLNYDNLMSEANNLSGGRWETGFSQNTSPGRFDHSRFYNAPQSLAFLHGSTRFGPFLSEATCHGVGFGVGLYGDPSDAASARENCGKLPEENQAGEKIYNNYMITGLDKFYTFTCEPYATYYRKLIKDLDSADTIWLIGYGGADQHLNLLLQSPLSVGKRFIVVDHRTGEVFGQKVVPDEHNLRKYIPEAYFAHAADQRYGEIVKFHSHCLWLLTGAERLIRSDDLINEVTRR